MKQSDHGKNTLQNSSFANPVRNDETAMATTRTKENPRLGRQIFLAIGSAVLCYLVAFALCLVFTNMFKRRPKNPDDLVELWAESYVDADGLEFLSYLPKEVIDALLEASDLSYYQLAKAWEDNMSKYKKRNNWSIEKAVPMSDSELQNLESQLKRYNIRNVEEAYYYVVWFGNEDDWVPVCKINSQWYVLSI